VEQDPAFDSPSRQIHETQTQTLRGESAPPQGHEQTSSEKAASHARPASASIPRASTAVDEEDPIPSSSKPPHIHAMSQTHTRQMSSPNSDPQSSRSQLPRISDVFTAEDEGGQLGTGNQRSDRPESERQGPTRSETPNTALEFENSALKRELSTLRRKLAAKGRGDDRASWEIREEPENVRPRQANGGAIQSQDKPMRSVEKTPHKSKSKRKGHRAGKKSKGKQRAGIDSEPSDSDSSSSSSSSSSESRSSRSSDSGTEDSDSEPASFSSRSRSASRRRHGRGSRHRLIKKGKAEFDKLSDGKDPLPKHWKKNVLSYLRRNASYPEPEDQMDFVFSMTRRPVSSYLFPLHDAGQYTTAKQMVKAAVRFLENPEQRALDKDDYDRLIMGDRETSVEFYTRFVTLAVGAKISRKRWRDDFWRKLNLRFRSALATKFIDIKTFEALYANVVNTEHQWSIINRDKGDRAGAASPNVKKQVSWDPQAKAATPANRVGYSGGMIQLPAPAPKNPSPAVRQSSQPPMTPRHWTGTPTPRQATPFDPDKGRCYKCKQPGHMSKDCPQNGAIAAMEYDNRLLVPEGTWLDDEDNVIYVFMEIDDVDSPQPNPGEEIGAIQTPSDTTNAKLPPGNGAA
jgi:hypothetical protein